MSDSQNVRPEGAETEGIPAAMKHSVHVPFDNYVLRVCLSTRDGLTQEPTWKYLLTMPGQYSPARGWKL